MECYRTDGRDDARKEIRCQCSQIAFQQKKDQNSTPTEKRKDTRRHIPDSSGTGHSQTFGKTFPTLDRIGNVQNFLSLG